MEASAGDAQALASTPHEVLEGGGIREVIGHFAHVGSASAKEDGREDFGGFLGLTGEPCPEALRLHGAGEFRVLQAESKDGPRGRAVGIARLTVEDGGGVEVLDWDLVEAFLAHQLRHLLDHQGMAFKDDIELVIGQDTPTGRVVAQLAREGHRQGGHIHQTDEFMGHRGRLPGQNYRSTGNPTTFANII